MAEGTPGGAPAAAPAAAATTPSTTTAPGIKPGAKPAAPSAPVESAWSDNDTNELVEKFKKSPFGKRKVDGKEETVSSVDDIKKWILQSQQGVSAKRTVEQANKEAAEAREAKAERDALKKALDRARRGDVNAFRELGFEDTNETDEQRRAFEALPPEAQQALRRSYELEQEVTRLQQEREAELKQREQAERQQTKQQTLTAARKHAEEILADVDPSRYVAEIPLIIQAMEELKAHGQKLGRDYTPEQLKAVVMEHREKGFYSQFDNLKPEAAFERLAPKLAAMTPEQLQKVLGKNFLTIGKKIGDAYRNHFIGKKAAAAEARRQPTPETKQDQGPAKSNVLSQFRFR